MMIKIIGKFLLISLTFPGGASSSQRIIQEIEKEFMKYSLKVLENSCNVIKEDGIILLRMQQQQKKGNLQDICNEMYYHRDKVLGMYSVVLSHLLNPSDSFTNINETEYGTNVLVGDVGDLSDVSFKATFGRH